MILVDKVRSLNAKLNPSHLYYDPEWLILGVNNICNLHCKMCDVGVDYNKSNFFQNLMGSRPLNMPEELIYEILDQVTVDFPSTRIGYAFTEPLIYPHLESSLRYANERNIFTSVTTNALNLKRYGDVLLENDLNELNISLDGPPDIHNFIRGHKSSFQKALEGINYLLEHDQRPDISVYCVVTEWNIGHLNDFLDYFSDIPLKRLGFMHTNFTRSDISESHNAIYGSKYPATASNMEEINIAAMDLDQLWIELESIKARKMQFPISFSPAIDSREELDVFYHHPEIFIGSRCNDVFNNLMIKSNGDVIPAHGRCYNLTVGNMYESNLKQIWNDEILSRFRRDLRKAGGLLPACSRCCGGFSGTPISKL